MLEQIYCPDDYYSLKIFSVSSTNQQLPFCLIQRLWVQFNESSLVSCACCLTVNQTCNYRMFLFGLQEKQQEPRVVYIFSGSQLFWYSWKWYEQQLLTPSFCSWTDRNKIIDDVSSSTSSYQHLWLIYLFLESRQHYRRSLYSQRYAEDSSGVPNLQAELLKSKQLCSWCLSDLPLQMKSESSWHNLLLVFSAEQTKISDFLKFLR